VHYTCDVVDYEFCFLSRLQRRELSTQSLFIIAVLYSVKTKVDFNGGHVVHAEDSLRGWVAEIQGRKGVPDTND